MGWDDNNKRALLAAHTDNYLERQVVRTRVRTLDYGMLQGIQPALNIHHTTPNGGWAHRCTSEYASRMAAIADSFLLRR